MRRVMLVATMLVCVGYGSVGRGQTIVSGSVSGLWTVANSPYVATGALNVAASLTIEPGVVVKFQAGGFGLTVGSGAKLTARGTSASPIVFEPYQGTAPGSWAGISLSSSASDDTLQNCVIRYAATGIIAGDSHPLVKDSSIYGCSGTGAYFNHYYNGPGATLIGCDIHDNATGVYFCAYDRYGAVNVTMKIGWCLIHDNTTYGVDIFSGTYWTSGSAYATADMANNSIVNNVRGVRAYAYRGNADARLTNTIVSDNSVYGVGNQDVASRIGAGDITYGCFWNNGPAGDTDFVGISGVGFGEVGPYVNANGDPCDINYNLYQDPLFISAAMDNYQLRGPSRCRDAGTDIVYGQFVHDPDGSNPEIGACYWDPNVSAVSSPKAPTTALCGISPNPFNPATTISFRLEESTTVLLEVYDLAGRRVAELLRGQVEAGDHEVPFDGRGLASGLYFARLVADGETQTGKMMLVK